MTDSFHKVFLTAGAGYIDSQTCVELLNAGVGVTVVDNFCNSHPLALPRVAQITGKNPMPVKSDFIQESATFGTSLHPSGASEVKHFVGLSQWVSRYKNCWPITRTIWQAA